MAIDPNALSATAVQTFSDEFNGSSLNQTVWGTAYPWSDPNGGTNAANREEQWYVRADYGPTSDLGTYTVGGGTLSIEARPTDAAHRSAVNGYDYTSGMINTAGSFTQTYGYFEMRADLPEGRGLWPAFWLLPADRSWPPELDVMEVIGSEPNVLQTTVHWNAGGHRQDNVSTTVQGLSQGMHTFGVNWQADAITWYLDGREVHRAATPADMHKPMYMLANLAVGGTWPGSPDGSTAFPADLTIDYIRAYQDRPAGSAPAPAPTPEAAPAPAPAPAIPAPAPVLAPAPEIATLPDSQAPTATVRGGYGWDTLRGSAGADLLDGREGGDRMAGRGGDDTYVLENYNDRVIEAPGGGIDTVRTVLDRVTLAAHVENVVLTGSGHQSAVGNGLANKMTPTSALSVRFEGGAGDDILIARRGPAQLTGGEGADVFRFEAVPTRAGHVTDFQPGVDRLDLTALLAQAGNGPVSDYLTLTRSGNGTAIAFDGDGTGAGRAQVVTHLDNVLPQALPLGGDWYFA